MATNPPETDTDYFDKGVMDQEKIKAIELERLARKRSVTHPPTHPPT